MCPVRARNSQKKKQAYRNQNWRMPFPRARVSGVPCSFQMKRSKVKVTGRQKPQKTGVMSIYGRPIKRRRVRRRLQTRPTPLVGLICCRRLRRSATRWTAAYHVGTRRQRAFLFTMRPSYRPHYASCSSVRLSVCLSDCPYVHSHSENKKKTGK